MSSRFWWQLVGAVALGILAAAAAGTILGRIYPTLLLFGLGLLIAHLLDPYLSRLQRRGWSRGQAVWFLTVLTIVVVGGTMTLVTPLLVRQVQSVSASLPTYVQKANQVYDQGRDWIVGRARNKGMAEEYATTIDQKMADLRSWINQRLPETLAWVSGQLMKSLSWVVLLALLVLVCFHFMLIIEHFRQGLRDMLPESASSHVRTLAAQMTAMLGQYFRGLLTTAVTVGILSALGLGIVSLIFGTRYWLLIGLTQGALYVVPWVGGILASALATFFGYTTAVSHPWAAALISLGAVAAINETGDVLIMPRIVGRRVGLHPLAVLFGILSGYQLFGFAGTMVAAPMMVAVKIILAHWLPVRGPGVEERAPSARLDIDVGAGAKQVWRAARRWGRRVEETFTRLGTIGHDEGASRPGPPRQEGGGPEQRDGPDASGGSGGPDAPREVGGPGGGEAGDTAGAGDDGGGPPS